MHYHCEVVLPAGTEDIGAALESIMAPFYEGKEEPDGTPTFWDWYVIGGRFAGQKLIDKYDSEKIYQFYEWCDQEKLTFSGVRCGKDKLEPASQIPKVDAKWAELFQTDPSKPCPLFEHSNNQYSSESLLDDDIAYLKDSLSTKCSRIIFAGPSFDVTTKKWTGPLEAKFMLSEEIWNGVNYEKSKWDGTVKGAVEMYAPKLEHYREEYADLVRPTDESICVTVDYHS